MCAPGIIVSWQMTQNSPTLLSPEVGCTFSTKTDLSSQPKNAVSEHNGNVFVDITRRRGDVQARHMVSDFRQRNLFRRAEPHTRKSVDKDAGDGDAGTLGCARTILGVLPAAREDSAMDFFIVLSCFCMTANC